MRQTVLVPCHSTFPSRSAFVAGLLLLPLLAGACGSPKQSISPEQTLVAPPDTTIPGARSASPEGTVHFAGLKRDHTTEPVVYGQNPPVGGPHDPEWQPCGVYTEPIATERGVHSMEHGAVWVTYSPDLPATEVDAIAALASGRSHVLVSPYVGLPAPIVASAWGEQLQLQQADDPRLAAFILYYEQGPQTPEPGVPC